MLVLIQNWPNLVSHTFIYGICLFNSKPTNLRLITFRQGWSYFVWRGWRGGAMQAEIWIFYGTIICLIFREICFYKNFWRSKHSLSSHISLNYYHLLHVLGFYVKFKHILFIMFNVYMLKSKHCKMVFMLLFNVLSNSNCHWWNYHLFIYLSILWFVY